MFDLFHKINCRTPSPLRLKEVNFLIVNFHHMNPILLEVSNFCLEFR